MKEAFQNADFVFADSIGIVWASKFLGCGKLVRTPGIDLILKFCGLAASRGYSVYLLGSRESVLRKVAENLEKKFPGLKIVEIHHRYFGERGDDRILKEVRNPKPHFLFVGLVHPGRKVGLPEPGEAKCSCLYRDWG